MKKTKQINYRQAVLNFINGECPPGEAAGEHYNPEFESFEDLERHCERNCVVPACFLAWLEDLEDKPCGLTVFQDPEEHITPQFVTRLASGERRGSKGVRRQIAEITGFEGEV